MITPLDIQNKAFTKGVRGYKEEEVDSFLDEITLDFERLIQDNKRLMDNLEIVTAEAERYRGSENAVLETLEAAKALMGEISASAEKRAEILLKNAEMEAERTRREAQESVKRLTEEAGNLRDRVKVFKNRFRNMLETELERFDTLSAELFPDGEFGELRLTDAGPVRHDAPEDKSPRRGAAMTDESAAMAGKTITNMRFGEED